MRGRGTVFLDESMASGLGGGYGNGVEDMAQSSFYRSGSSSGGGFSRQNERGDESMYDSFSGNNTTIQEQPQQPESSDVSCANELLACCQPAMQDEAISAALSTISLLAKGERVRDHMLSTDALHRIVLVAKSRSRRTRETSAISEDVLVKSLWLLHQFSSFPASLSRAGAPGLVLELLSMTNSMRALEVSVDVFVFVFVFVSCARMLYYVRVGACVLCILCSCSSVHALVLSVHVW
jgi:hypothetical protein